MIPVILFQTKWLPWDWTMILWWLAMKLQTFGSKVALVLFPYIRIPHSNRVDLHRSSATSATMVNRTINVITLSVLLSLQLLNAFLATASEHQQAQYWITPYYDFKCLQLFGGKDWGLRMNGNSGTCLIWYCGNLIETRILQFIWHSHKKISQLCKSTCLEKLHNSLITSYRFHHIGSYSIQNISTFCKNYLRTWVELLISIY